MKQSIYPLDSSSVEFVIDQQMNREYPAAELLPTDDREIGIARLKAFEDRQQKRAGIICAACHSLVWPKRTPDRTHVYYSHFAGDSDNCPYENNTSNQNIACIDAMRYNGQKEGDAHLRMKNLLVESIKADHLGFIAEPKVEKNWYGSSDPKKWRRPDVSAEYELITPPLRIAFEVQLSSTYLHVISARRQFYLEENALLFWIFKDGKNVDPRQYQDDLFYNNNSNLFIVDEETLAISKDSRKFYLRCQYLEPVIREMNIAEIWQEKIVSF